METKIMFERIIAGGILKFGKVDSVDISLIVKDIDKVFEIDIDKETMDKYVVFDDGNILLCDRFINEVYKNINYNKLEKLSVNMIDIYFKNMDMDMFVLRKIKLLGDRCVLRDDLIHNFSVVQLYSLWNLYNNGYVEDYLLEDSEYGDYKVVRISKLGFLKLFMDENYMDICKFHKDLMKMNVDCNFINGYFLEMDLGADKDYILNVDNYLDYVSKKYVFMNNGNCCDDSSVCRKLVNKK